MTDRRALSIALGRRPVKMCMMVAAGLASIAAAVMIATRGDRGDLIAALGVLVLGAVVVSGLKASAETATPTRKSVRSNSEAVTAIAEREVTAVAHGLATTNDEVRGLQHDESVSRVRPADVIRLMEDVDSGTIPPERISDHFPDEAIGLSGRKFRTLVCELVRLYRDQGTYLEVGTYRGMTICASAVSNPGVEHIGVDDFSQVDDQGQNRSVFRALVDRLALENIDFFEQDFHAFLSNRTLVGVRDVAVYYFDASHDYRSQLLALLHGSRQTIEGGVMLIDDTNYSHVRAASYDFCEFNPEWALVFERYTAGHPNRVDPETAQEMREGWWDGVHVLVHDPGYRVERLGRQPDPSLERFFLAQHVAVNCHTSEVHSRIARVADA